MYILFSGPDKKIHTSRESAFDTLLSKTYIVISPALIGPNPLTHANANPSPITDMFTVKKILKKTTCFVMFKRIQRYYKRHIIFITGKMLPVFCLTWTREIKTDKMKYYYWMTITMVENIFILHFFYWIILIYQLMIVIN